MKDFKIFCILFSFIALLSVIINLNTGYISLSITDFFYETSLSQIVEMRVNRVLAMLLVGVSIPTSGFLLQEYFQNPLAGPSVLGITSIANLAVAFYIFFSTDFHLPELLQNSFISIISIIGSILLMFLILTLSKRFQDKSFLIIFGFLVSSLAGALVSILQLYSEAQNIKNYILWTFGGNNQITSHQLIILFFMVLFGLVISFRCIKPLIGNALGINYARSLGVNIYSLKYAVIIASSILSASVTAFLGPILFIGIVVPHFCRIIYSPAKLWHQWILNLIFGIIVMELFSTVSEITQLSINIITSILGIPVIFLMLIKRKNGI